MSTKSSFRSEQRHGYRLCLSFEKIMSTYWTDAGTLRALVAEMDRLEVPDSKDIQLRHRSEGDELGPIGWALDLYATENPT